MKRKATYIFLTLLLLVVSLLLWAGQNWFKPQLSPKEQLQRILNSSNNCYVPCWHGLEFGYSTEEDFLALVNNSPKKHFSDLTIMGPTQYFWDDTENDLHGYLETKNGLLAFVKIYTSAMQIETIFAELGEPDRFSIGVQGDIDTTFLQIRFFYIPEGVVVERTDVNPSLTSCQFNLTNTLIIDSIYITSPGNDSTAKLVGAIKNNLGLIHHWEGFGEIEMKPCLVW